MVISFLCLHRSVFHLCLPNNLQKEFLHGLQILIPDQLIISLGDTSVEHTLQIMMVIDMDIPFRAGSCENGISDSIPILILGNHRFQNFWKGTHVKIESE